MTFNLTCLSTYPPIPSVPVIANDSSTIIHPSYTPNSGGLTQLISSSLARSTFSIDDVRSLLKNIFNNEANSWDASEIIKTKPIPSTIIYSSITLGLFLIFSLTFCIASCCNTNKKQSHQEKKRRQSKSTRVFVCLLIIVYLLGIGDMIYVAYRVNKSKLSIDDSIKQVNRDVYPKEISEHMEYLINQFENLDQYCSQPNSILINASKSMLIKSFNGTLQEKYFVYDILQSVNNIDRNIEELDKETIIPPAAIPIFQRVKDQYRQMNTFLQLPLQEICNYANGAHTDIDKKLLEGLDVVHQQLRKIINTVKTDILNKITPWQNHMLIDTDLEEQIRNYMTIAGNICLVLVVFLAVIPLAFCIFIIIFRLCSSEEEQLPSRKIHDDRVRMNTIHGSSNMPPMNNYSDHRNKSYQQEFTRVPLKYNRREQRQSKTSAGPSRVTLCLMRIAFGLMIIMLIVMVLLTGVYYSLDLAVQGACRTVHDDQPFLVSLITDKVIGPNVTFIDGSDLNTTVINVINDCRDRVHFSRKLLVKYWSTFDRDITEMMNMLSKLIFDQFILSSGLIDIPADIDLLTQFLIQANISNIPAKVKEIDTNLYTVQTILGKITSSNSTLPQDLVQTTIDEFEDYVKKVIESTVDGCPLPLATIYKTDTLVCHTLGSSLNGLWLSVFLYMLLVTVGLCIFGIFIYKRLD